VVLAVIRAWCYCRSRSCGFVRVLVAGIWGFAALTAEFDGVLLVDVEERLGDTHLEIEAWNDFVTATQ
jgi:hypothetical protein